MTFSKLGSSVLFKQKLLSGASAEAGWQATYKLHVQTLQVSTGSYPFKPRREQREQWGANRGVGMIWGWLGGRCCVGVCACVKIT